MTISLIASASYRAAAQRLADIMTAEDSTSEQLSDGIEQLASAVADEVREQFVSADGDNRVLEARGFRTLTSEERAYYERFADAAMNARSYQDFVSSMEGANLPQTVIDEVMEAVKLNHPLLGMIRSRAVARITKMYFNATSATQKAQWGDLDSAIVAEITGGFKEIDATQQKLSAFAQISQDELKLGPTYLNELVVSSVAESIANGLEDAVINGTGLHQPIGMRKSIVANVSVNQTTGYPDKTPIALPNFSRAAVDAILATMAANEDGRPKNINITSAGETLMPAFGFACNLTDWFGKIDNAAHIMGTGGDEMLAPGAKMLQFVQSAFVPSGKAVMFIPNEYYLLVAGDRGLEASDEFKFLDDKRVYKQVMYGDGRCYDDNSAKYLDISSIAPTYATVGVLGEVQTTAAQTQSEGQTEGQTEG